MSNVFRIAFHKMLVLLRLAIIASLTVYTLPSASFAMHSDASTTYSAQRPVSHDIVQMDDGDHHEHGVGHDMAKSDQKPIKQDCCSDFCISLAIIDEAPDFWRAVPRPALRFDNDSLVVGQLSSLHRPPSIRA